MNECQPLLVYYSCKQLFIYFGIFIDGDMC